VGLMSLVPWMTPGLRTFDGLALFTNGTLLGVALGYAAQAVAVMFVEPFYVAAGFAMYLNRRVELEAWDVEQDLRHAFGQR